MKENILLKHKKGVVRFENKDFILYEPNNEQKEILLNIINKVSNITTRGDEDVISGELTLDDSRWVLSELTNMKDYVNELTDEELIDIINNPDCELVNLINAIKDLLIELSHEKLNEYLKELETTFGFYEKLSNNKNIDSIKKKLNKIFDKDKMDSNIYEALIKEGVNIEELIEVLNNKKK